ncbi:hypothetical protein EJB05_35216 [Eragrostis curvula]|uniref:PHD finger protein ALFIN-LIKE n=1 Tax=Eragrostis curvula TaxID=38414 RepID=A0A5J9U699_9POAL|nr:hypothetical protein EJB05_35216 [Eragrostis curvula]
MDPSPPKVASAPPSKPVLDLNGEPVEAPTELVPPSPEKPRMEVFTGQITAIYQIFRQFSGRRAALIRAITRDEEEFSRKCNSSLESMCLYGHINGSWEVRVPELLAQPSLPEPMRGINLFRDNMEHVQWLQEVAKRCDSWLISLSFFVGANILNANGRWMLFNHLNSLETVHEAFLQSDTYHRLHREEEVRPKRDVGDEEVDDKDDYFCDICGHPYHANGFWICCDLCGGWSHGRCVKVKPEQLECVKQYVCPECISEREGHDSEYAIKMTMGAVQHVPISKNPNKCGFG